MTKPLPASKALPVVGQSVQPPAEVGESSFGRAKVRRASPTRRHKVVQKSHIVLKPDTKVPFPAVFVTSDKLTAQRRYVADEAKKWLEEKLRQGKQGAVVFDIDDTLINGNEAVAHGFQYMVELYRWALQHFPVELVTARPEEEKSNVMRMLHKRKLFVGFNNLHMMNTKEYNSGDTTYVKNFKWGKHLDFVKMYKDGVLAKMGDRLWDVAERHSPSTYLKHVPEELCYIFTDPKLGGTRSFKLPEGKHRG